MWEQIGWSAVGAFFGSLTGFLVTLAGILVFDEWRDRRLEKERVEMRKKYERERGLIPEGVGSALIRDKGRSA